MVMLSVAGGRVNVFIRIYQSRNVSFAKYWPDKNPRPSFGAINFDCFSPARFGAC